MVSRQVGGETGDDGDGGVWCLWVGRGQWWVVKERCLHPGWTHTQCMQHRRTHHQGLASSVASSRFVVGMSNPHGHTTCKWEGAPHTCKYGREVERMEGKLAQCTRARRIMLNRMANACPAGPASCTRIVPQSQGPSGRPPRRAPPSTCRRPGPRCKARAVVVRRCAWSWGGSRVW